VLASGRIAPGMEARVNVQSPLSGEIFALDAGRVSADRGRTLHETQPRRNQF